MSYSKNDVDTMLSQIVDHFKLEIDDVQKVVSNIYKPTSMFASKSAEDKAGKNKIDISKLKRSSKDKRITLQDVNSFLGEVNKETKPKEFVSKQAYEEAQKNNLKYENFSDKEKSGIDRKTKKKTKITLDDVRNKVKNNASPFASKQAEKLAKDTNVKHEDISGSGRDGKIRKVDVEDYLKSLEREKGEESGEESEGEECGESDCEESEGEECGEEESEGEECGEEECGEESESESEEEEL
jgi:pyruvate/2-oxoglutarate dehydrogenase complex dihydrolipoamide acyltransferase (E2) component